MTPFAQSRPYFRTFIACRRPSVLFRSKYSWAFFSSRPQLIKQHINKISLTKVCGWLEKDRVSSTDTLIFFAFSVHNSKGRFLTSFRGRSVHGTNRSMTSSDVNGFEGHSPSHKENNHGLHDCSFLPLLLLRKRLEFSFRICKRALHFSK